MGRVVAGEGGMFTGDFADTGHALCAPDVADHVLARYVGYWAVACLWDVSIVCFLGGKGCWLTGSLMHFWSASVPPTQSSWKVA